MKTIMNNKMFKVILLVAIFATTQVSLVRVSAQTTETEKPAVEFVYSSGAQMEIGDTVMIHKDSLRYITGERMSSWVYGVPHQIRQLGTKSKPTGVLLRGIYSWIAQGSLIPLNVHKTQEYIDAQHAAAVAAAEAEAAARAAAEAEAAAAEAEAARLLAELEEDTVVEVKDTVVPDLPFEVNRFSVGVRGGLASLMPQSAVQPSMSSAWGFGVALDLQYAHYWAADQDKIRLGIMTGLSAGYMSTTRSQAWDETYIAKTDDGDIEYHVTADNIQETNHQLQLEIPLMFSLITAKGLFFNVGPRFLLPAYTPYKQVITNGNVVATDLQTGVVIPNNPVYGQLSEEQVNQKGKGEQQFDLTMTLGFELGYEFKLKSGNSIGLGAFLNYGVYSMYSNKPLGSAIDVTAPSKQDDKNAVVNVESLTNAYTEKMGHLDAGVKVSFNLDFVK